MTCAYKKTPPTDPCVTESGPATSEGARAHGEYENKERGRLENEHFILGKLLAVRRVGWSGDRQTTQRALLLGPSEKGLQLKTKGKDHPGREKV